MAGQFESRSRRISELEKKCRAALQYDSVFKQITSRKTAYEKMCALLDFVGDSEEALLSVISFEQRRSLNRYFLGYGMLQLLYSRQVAVRDVIRTLGLTIPEPLNKSALTVARDCIIGHPIESDGAAHIIARHTLNENGFEYWSYYPNTVDRGKIVKYEPLIEAHLDAMEVGMETLYQHIAQFENQRRRQMRNDPLSPTLQGVPYLIQQICAALVEKRYGDLFSASTASLLSALDRFRAGLVKRFGEENTAYVLEGVHMLKSLFPPKNAKEANQYRVVSDGVEINIKRVINMAADIDEQERNDLT
jgi:hypothetical protein